MFTFFIVDIFRNVRINNFCQSQLVVASLSLPEVVSDGNWHRATWTYEDGLLSVTVDNNTASSPLDWDVNVQSRDNNITLFVGARPFPPGMIRIYYCLFRPVLKVISLEVTCPYDPRTAIWPYGNRR